MDKTIKSSARGTVKTAGKRVKTAQRTYKTTIKTTEEMVQTTQKTAKVSAIATQKTVYGAKTTAKAGVQMAKAAIRTIVSVIRMIIAETKALFSALIAGGWIAVLIILIGINGVPVPYFLYIRSFPQRLYNFCIKVPVFKAFQHKRQAD